MHVMDKEGENAFAHHYFSLGSAKRLLDSSDKLRMSLSTDMAAWFLGFRKPFLVSFIATSFILILENERLLVTYLQLQDEW